MSGNLEEWVAGPSTRGGSFEDDNISMRCNGEGELPDTATPGNSVGFRCCADPQ
jgi:formylglycine-generating enzyme required for sulfatase activity